MPESDVIVSVVTPVCTLRATTFAPTTTAPRTTIPRRRDDDGGDRKDRKPAPQPREFSLKFGEDYLIPKPLDPRVLLWIPTGAPGYRNAPVASAAHRDEFRKAPEKYAPQYGGYCAWAVSQNYTADADPEQ